MGQVLLFSSTNARIRESVADAARIQVEVETVNTGVGPVVAVKVPPRPRGIPFHTCDGKFPNLVHANPGIDVDQLLVIHFLTRHREIDARTASQICQWPIENAREILNPRRQFHKINYQTSRIIPHEEMRPPESSGKRCRFLPRVYSQQPPISW